MKASKRAPGTGGRAAATRRKGISPGFWALVGLSVITLIAGVWWMTARGQAQSTASAEPTPAAVAESSDAAAVTDFSVQTVSGETIRLSDLRGKVVLLNFWATWCPPCKAEMPDLDALHREYGANHEFMVLAVNVQEKPEVVRAFAEAKGLALTVGIDEQGAISAGQFKVRSLPTSVIIDRTGVVRSSWLGQLTKEQMLARLSAVW